MLNYFWASTSHLYHGNQHYTLVHAYTLREQLPRHPAPRQKAAFSDQTNLLSCKLDTQSTSCLSLPISVSSSLLPFPSLLQWISFVMSQNNYLLSEEDKVLQCSVGAALGRVVTEEKKLCRDPERCPGMQLNRHRTHASTTTITTSESSSGSSIRRGGVI